MTAAVSLKCPWVPGVAPLGCWRPGWRRGGLQGTGCRARREHVWNEGAGCKGLTGHQVFADSFMMRPAPPGRFLGSQGPWQSRGGGGEVFTNHRWRTFPVMSDRNQCWGSFLQPCQETPCSNLARLIVHCWVDVCPAD